MLVLIVKDAATKVPREVADMDEVRALRGQGWTVEVDGEEPEQAEEAAPEPEATPEATPAPAPAAKKAAAKKSAKR
jgi:hypothetical protein